MNKNSVVDIVVVALVAGSLGYWAGAQHFDTHQSGSPDLRYRQAQVPTADSSISIGQKLIP